MSLLKYKTDNGYETLDINVTVDPSQIESYGYQTEEQVNTLIQAALDAIDVAEEGSF